MKRSVMLRNLAAVWVAALLLGNLPVIAAPITHLAGASGSLVSATDNQFYFDVDYNPGGSFAAASLSRDGMTLSGSSNLAAGELKMRSTGAVGITYGNVNAAAAGYLLDTITATGSLGGSNLGVGLSIHGTTVSSDYQNNANFLLIGFYAPGHLQAATDGLRNFYDPAYRIWGAAYAFGDQASQTPNLSGYNYTVTGWFGDGHHLVPISVPFGLLGNAFEIHLLLGSQQLGSSVTLSTWDNDFVNTVGVELFADPGITLYSASGALPGTLAQDLAGVPEPETWALLLPAAAVLIWCQRRRSVSSC